MIIPPGPLKVSIAVKPVDFRKGMVGLASLVQHELHRDPFSRIMFVLRRKRADRIKLLLWDGTGLVLVTKRLETGSFRWPRFGDGVMSLTAGRASALIEGLDWASYITGGGEELSLTLQRADDLKHRIDIDHAIDAHAHPAGKVDNELARMNRLGGLRHHLDTGECRSCDFVKLAVRHLPAPGRKLRRSNLERGRDLDTEAPGSIVSATAARFSETDQRRRHRSCSIVMTPNQQDHTPCTRRLRATHTKNRLYRKIINHNDRGLPRMLTMDRHEGGRTYVRNERHRPRGLIEITFETSYNEIRRRLPRGNRRRCVHRGKELPVTHQ
ncbi:IS66 family insertion sequence element accessory protein TnpB [Sphingopyxis sp. YR583]|uniref:IS66 family insertion sequence element accessory protein TnpB n=1 Tax=Sphingopyxis sp. YR583 TaxID=1881047 RepID=UPI001C434F9A|nr:IS66 family insertion sequence element accessory protein TnpB [Sphingopyxis sp. YR583]